MTNQELQSLKNKYDIIGNDPVLNRALEIAVAVAPTDITVLVSGESGVGKDNIPRIIHQNSRRRNAKYFAINCGAIPEGFEDVDMIQIGARNMQNFDLLKEMGKVNKPILLKRGMSATVKELLMSAEYIMASGNEDVIFCERGVRTFDNYTRNCLDLSIVPYLHKISHLPVIIDPSHACGQSWMVPTLAKAAVASGADGLIIEVHNNPEKALCDGEQSLTPDEFNQLMNVLPKLADIENRTM